MTSRTPAEILIASAQSLRDTYLEFTEKHWQGNISEMQAVITGHLFVENALDQIFEIVFAQPQSLKRFTYVNKLQLTRALGDVTEESLVRLEKLGTLRNKFAHNLDYVVSYKDIQSFQVDGITKKQWEADKIDILLHCISYTAGTIHGWVPFYHKRISEENERRLNSAGASLSTERGTHR